VFHFFDPIYLMFMIPAMLISLLAQAKVKRTFAKYTRVPMGQGMTGADIAHEILLRNGITDVRVEPTQGFLSDHYDSRGKVLRLSPDVYHGRSISSAGVAAHEVGHAIQHSEGYAPLYLRQIVAPMAKLGSNLAWILLMIGFFLQASGFIYAGIIGFSFMVLFTLLTLPVEFDASSRAKRVLQEMGFISQAEGKGVAAVLNAAALTYVAAAITAILQLLYFLLRSGLLGNRN
jgi:hypothetical protein